MRPRLRDDVYFAPVSDGVAWLSGSGSLKLSGASVATVVERLAPLLDGRNTLEDLTSSLSAEHREMVTNLITLLVERGMADDADHDRARVRIDRYRTGRALVIGPRETTGECVRALLRSGVREVVPTCEFDPDLLNEADFVLHVFGHADIPSACRTTRLAHDLGLPFVHALVSENHALIRFPSGSDWASVWRRLRPTDAEALRTASGPPAPPALQVLANHLAFRLSCQVARLPGGDDDQILWFDAHTLAVSRHHVLPAAVLPTDRSDGAEPESREAFRRSIRRLQHVPRWSTEDFSLRVVRAIDARFGLIRLLDEGDLEQVPLRRSRAVVAHDVTVSSYGRDFATARHRTAMRAVAAHGALAVDPQRLHHGGGPPRRWGLRLTDGEPCLVDAREAHPVLGSDGRLVPVGATAGLDWEQAMTTGLLAHVRRAVLAGASPLSGTRVDLDAVNGDHVSAGHLRLLTAAGYEVGLVDLGDSIRVPTVTGVLDGRVVEVVSRLSVAEALRDALEALVYAAQAEEPVSALTEVRPRHGVWRPQVDVTVSDVVEALQRIGLTPVFVPYDHDPALERIVPCIGGVVMTHE